MRPAKRSLWTRHFVWTKIRKCVFRPDIPYFSTSVRIHEPFLAAIAPACSELWFVVEASATDMHDQLDNALDGPLDHYASMHIRCYDHCAYISSTESMVQD
jgi:hypothetical protein